MFLSCLVSVSVFLVWVIFGIGRYFEFFLFMGCVDVESFRVGEVVFYDFGGLGRVFVMFVI